MSTNDAFAVIDEVSFSYGEKIILNRVKLTLNEGTTYALIGKSGTGKSTFLNLMAGFLKPNQGRITVRNKELIGTRKSTAFLFQELGLFPWQTVYQTIAMPLKIEKVKGKEDVSKAVKSILTEMGLDDLIHKYPHELSGGERQRVALARTMIGKPDFILMDEPTSSLDAMTKEEIQQLILKQQRKLKSTMLFVTHDIEEAVQLGERILLLNTDGMIQVIENPFFAQDKAKEQLRFYDTCIRIRKLLRGESNEDEAYSKDS